jgi:hypothetical protein
MGGADGAAWDCIKYGIFIEIITSRLIQFDFAFLPRTQKGAGHIQRVQVWQKGCNVRRFKKPRDGGVRAESQEGKKYVFI